MIESAIERIIRKVLAEKIELIFMEAIQKVVKEDIKKIKEHVLEQGKHDTWIYVVVRRPGQNKFCGMKTGD